MGHFFRTSGNCWNPWVNLGWLVRLHAGFLLGEREVVGNSVLLKNVGVT